ncbi:hypothetical protein DPMN_188100 [Dreissena polymorpha]|uniref:Uncharacterized protein n=1 Tax=Dreissena polymorpha TaxID=45954 RepID=A0A9D4DQP0_DREPO|nr:hypothetical protein DPMN_188100 [Dreissena polymorpha]
MVSWSQTPSDTSWPRTLGQMLNYTYPQGGATLNLGLHTFLARGQVYLVNKNPRYQSVELVLEAFAPATVIISSYWHLYGVVPSVYEHHNST